jgi:hypothetical protein
LACEWGSGVSGVVARSVGSPSTNQNDKRTGHAQIVIAVVDGGDAPIRVGIARCSAVALLVSSSGARKALRMAVTQKLAGGRIWAGGHLPN